MARARHYISLTTLPIKMLAWIIMHTEAAYTGKVPMWAPQILLISAQTSYINIKMVRSLLPRYGPGRWKRGSCENSGKARRIAQMAARGPLSTRFTQAASNKHSLSLAVSARHYGCIFLPDLPAALLSER